MTLVSRQIELASRPDGWPTPDNFRLAETTVQDPAPGQLVVRNLVMSVDPYMRPRMNDVKSYVPPYQIGQPLDGGAVGEVVASTVDTVREGDIVLHWLGWREYAVVNAAAVTVLDPDAAPLNAYLGMLGMPGLTAWAGLFEVGRFTAGDTVWVSAASGAVGQIAGQLAKLHGAARVIGSAGSGHKVRRLLVEYNFDAAFDYHDGDVTSLLRDAAPHGIDLYFDNVGGDHLEAAIAVANVRARFVLCGAIAGYNTTEKPVAPRNLNLVIGKRLRLSGMLVTDHADQRRPFFDAVAPHVRAGTLRYDETVFDGVENAPDAFLAMLRGDTTGKTLVALAARACST